MKTSVISAHHPERAILRMKGMKCSAVSGTDTFQSLSQSSHLRSKDPFDHSRGSSFQSQIQLNTRLPSSRAWSLFSFYLKRGFHMSRHWCFSPVGENLHGTGRFNAVICNLLLCLNLYLTNTKKLANLIVILLMTLLMIHTFSVDRSELYACHLSATLCVTSFLHSFKSHFWMQRLSVLSKRWFSISQSGFYTKPWLTPLPVNLLIVEPSRMLLCSIDVFLCVFSNFLSVLPPSDFYICFYFLNSIILISKDPSNHFH